MKNTRYINSITFNKGKISYYGNYFGIGTRLNFCRIFFVSLDSGLTIYLDYIRSEEENYFKKGTILNAKAGIGIKLFRIDFRNKNEK